MLAVVRACEGVRVVDRALAFKLDVWEWVWEWRRSVYARARAHTHTHMNTHTHTHVACARACVCKPAILTAALSPDDLPRRPQSPNLNSKP